MGYSLAGISFAILTLTMAYVWSVTEQATGERAVWALAYLVCLAATVIFNSIGIFNG